MKQIIWTTPNKMAIKTGHSTYDKQCSVVSAGNVIAPTQSSCYIRAKNNTECNGFQFPVGHLRDCDLKYFDHMPSHVQKCILSETETKNVILYQFFHYAGGGRITHGYVVTDSSHKLVGKFCTGPTYKSHGVIDEVTLYITD